VYLKQRGQNYTAKITIINKYIINNPIETINSRLNESIVLPLHQHQALVGNEEPRA
jgi:hypothetical protein